MSLSLIVSFFFITTQALNLRTIQEEEKWDLPWSLFHKNSDLIAKKPREISDSVSASLFQLPSCGQPEDDKRKVCVPYHRCDPDTNTIVPEGSKSPGRRLIDIRMNRTECANYLDICCNPSPDDVVLQPQSPTPSSQTTTKPSLCGIRNENGLDFKISGNTYEAEYGEFPWMVALLKNDNKNEYICGASLIAPNTVMTTARCVRPYQTWFEEKDLKIRAGEWDPLTDRERLPYQERNVTKIIVHEMYSDVDLYYNVALLILERPIDPAENIGTICLPRPKQIFNSKDCYVSGWKKNRFGKSTNYSAILGKAKVPMIPKDKCEDIITAITGSPLDLNESYICVSNEADTDSCVGDNGGPVVCPDPDVPGRYVQVGIINIWLSCIFKFFPNTQSNVPNVRQWIDDQLQELGISSESYTI